MATNTRPANALVLNDVAPGLTVVHHWSTHADVLEIIGGPVDYTFDVDGNPVTTPALLVKKGNDEHHRSLYFLGLAPDGGKWSGNHLTRA